MKRYYLNNGNEIEVTLHRATHELSKLYPIVSSEINYINHIPVEV